MGRLLSGKMIFGAVPITGGETQVQLPSDGSPAEDHCNRQTR